jgi:arachidonate 15-lipoxygenase
VAGELVPVAIQCGQDPSAHPIYGPWDGASWLMARTTVTIADGNWQGIVAHFALCHQVMESVILAAHRQLSDEHPLFVLLAPHFDNTMITNDIAMSGLVGPGGYMERLQSPTLDASLALATRQIDAFRLGDSAPRKDFAARGCDDLGALGDYPARDDGLLVWDATFPWIDGYVRLYYASDADVAADVELAAWVDEMGSRDGGRLNGLARPATVAQLVDLIAQIVFRCTAYHASINYPSFDLFGYTPNMQAAGFAPGPTGTAADTEDARNAMLPPYEAAFDGFTLFYEITLQLNRIGEYPRFADDRVQPLLAAYQGRLAEVEDVITAKNTTRKLAYPYLLPSRISRSIHV